MLTLAAASLYFCLIFHFVALVPLLAKAYSSSGWDFLWWMLQHPTSGGITGAERFSNSPAASGSCSELRVEPQPLELAPSHGHRSLAQKLRASASSAKPVLGNTGCFWSA